MGLKKMSEAIAEKAILYEPRLCVAGPTPRSLATIANLRNICELRFKSKYHIEVIDLLVTPQLAKGDHLVAVPTLVRTLPQPIRKVRGGLSDTEKIIVGLNIGRSDGQKG
jgi:circadian clock protein KaiB